MNRKTLLLAVLLSLFAVGSFLFFASRMMKDVATGDQPVPESQIVQEDPDVDRRIGEIVIPPGVYSMGAHEEWPSRTAAELFGNSTERGMYSIHTERTYMNKDLGFSIKLPDSWTRYAVRQTRDADSAEVFFGLPVDGDSMLGVNRWDDPEYASMVLDIYSIRIVPVSDYDVYVKKCAAPDVDYPCHVDPEITRTATHVYAGHQMNVHWIPCAEAEDLVAEPYACSVYGDFFLPLQKSDTFRKSFALTR